MISKGREENNQKGAFQMVVYNSFGVTVFHSTHNNVLNSFAALTQTLRSCAAPRWLARRYVAESTLIIRTK